MYLRFLEFPKEILEELLEEVARGILFIIVFVRILVFMPLYFYKHGKEER